MINESLHSPSAQKIRQELSDPFLRDLFGTAGGEKEIIDEAYVREHYDNAVMESFFCTLKTECVQASS